MSGHSKWAQIKRQKGVTDAKRGQVFTKLAREIMIAVRQGGGDPQTNAHLHMVVQKAKDHNMPMENIERAIKRSSSSTEGSALQEGLIEGYGPGGVAILVDTLTDNRNRILQDVRNLFSRSGGNLGESGCVSWLFQSKGVITLESAEMDTEELVLLAIDAGAEDVQVEKGFAEILTKPDGLGEIRKVLEDKNIPIVSAEISLVPQSTLELEEETALKTLRLIDKLEELDDVQRVFSNLDFSEATMEKLRAHV